MHSHFSSFWQIHKLSELQLSESTLSCETEAQLPFSVSPVMLNTSEFKVEPFIHFQFLSGNV